MNRRSFFKTMVAVAGAAAAAFAPKFGDEPESLDLDGLLSDQPDVEALADAFLDTPWTPIIEYDDLGGYLVPEDIAETLRAQFDTSAAWPDPRTYTFHTFAPATTGSTAKFTIDWSS